MRSVGVGEGHAVVTEMGRDGGWNIGLLSLV